MARPLDYAPPPPPASLRERVGGFVFERRGRTRSADIANTYRSLATQLDAGLDIRRASSTLARQQGTRSAFGRALADVRDRLETGDTLATAMADHADVFGEADVRAVEAAERAGVLEQALNRLARGREASVRLRKRATSALMYPAAVMTVALLVVLLLFTFVVPTILEPIVKSGRPLPLPTLIVSGFSSLLIGWWWLLGLLAIGGFFVVKRLLRVPSYRRAVDAAVLQVPVVGPMLLKHATAQAATLLGTVVQAGLGLVEAIDLAARAARNKAVGAALGRWRDEVEAGEDVGDAFRNAGVFPPLATEMVEVGAATGTIDATMAKLAETYENDVEETARRLGSLVEPAIIVFLAGIVLLIALAVLLPILELGSVFAP